MYALEVLSLKVNDHHIAALGRGKNNKEKMVEEDGKGAVSVF